MKPDTALRYSRRGEFGDEDLLVLFQPTALTREWEPYVISEIDEFGDLATSLENRNEIRVLDIGGGEGTASAELLSRLFTRMNRDDLKVKIDLYETEERRDLYVRYIRERFGERINVTFHGLFSRDSKLRQYDLIIALHSFYALADGWHHASDFLNGLTESKMKLQASLIDEGKIIGSLGSLFGVSALYKRFCMMELLGEVVLDLTLEELTEIWQPSSQVIVDGYFKLSSIEGETMTQPMVVAWIKYFAHICDTWLSEEQERHLILNLMEQTIAFEDLPSCDQKVLNKLNLVPDEIYSKIPFLPHKTGVFMLGRVDRV